MIAVAVIAAVVGIVGLVGHFQMGDEMSRVGMDVCVAAAVIAIIYSFFREEKAAQRTCKAKEEKSPHAGSSGQAEIQSGGS